MSDLAIIDSAPVPRAAVFNLEKYTLAMPQVEIAVKHYFGHNTCAREITIPAGVTMTGAIQKYSCVNILSKGSIRVLTANGIMEDVSAPWTEVTPAGTKRVGTTYTECVWTTIFSTDKTDVDEIVEHFTTNDEAVYLAFAGSLNLEGK